MKLFTKDINEKLFKQYALGSDLSKQKAVAKIFNPYGKGRWFLLNSDPNDPDYLWAIVEMNGEVEMGSVSRKELESIRFTPWRLPLERDLGFRPINAEELYKGLREGKFYKRGGYMAKGGELTNKEAYDLVTKNKNERGGVWEENAYNILRNDAMQKPNEKFEPIGDLDMLVKYLNKGGYMAEGGGIDHYKAFDLDSEGELSAIIDGKQYKIRYRDDETQLYDLYEDGKKIESSKSVRELMKFSKGGYMEDGGQIYRSYKEVYKGVTFKTEKEVEDFIKTGKPFLRKQLKDGKFVVVNNGEGYFIAEVVEDKMSDGGRIKDQYEGRSAEDVWNNLSKEQRQHFLYDHKDQIEAYRGEEHGELKSKEIIQAYNSDWSNLDKDIKNRFSNHVREGQYAKGGEMAFLTQKSIKDIVSVLHKAKESGNVFSYKIDGKEAKLDFNYAFDDSDISSLNLRLDNGGDYYDKQTFNPKGDEKKIVEKVKDFFGKKMAKGGMNKRKEDIEDAVRILHYYMVGEKLSYDNKKFVRDVVNKYGNRELKKKYGDFGSNFVTFTKKDISNLYWELKTIQDKGSMADGGEMDVRMEDTVQRMDDPNFADPAFYANGGGVSDGMETVNYLKSVSGLRASYIAQWADINQVNLYKVKEAIKKKKLKPIDFSTAVSGKDGNPYAKKIIKEYGQNKMGKGGKVKFSEKVKSISRSLLKRKKVSPSVQKDYGKTYNKKEAVESAKRIAGAMRKKELSKKKVK